MLFNIIYVIICSIDIVDKRPLAMLNGTDGNKLAVFSKSNIFVFQNDLIFVPSF